MLQLVVLCYVGAVGINTAAGTNCLTSAASLVL